MHHVIHAMMMQTTSAAGMAVMRRTCSSTGIWYGGGGEGGEGGEGGAPGGGSAGGSGGELGGTPVACQGHAVPSSACIAPTKSSGM